MTDPTDTQGDPELDALSARMDALAKRADRHAEDMTRPDPEPETPHATIPIPEPDPEAERRLRASINRHSAEAGS